MTHIINAFSHIFPSLTMTYEYYLTNLIQQNFKIG